jgi:predicted permease
VLCVLLIACVNLSNLLLTRANARGQEFSMRIALGAGHWHLVRQTMTESQLLAFAGCLLGVLVASVATAPLARLQAFNIPLLRTTSLDPTTLIVAVGLACIAALLCAVLPVLQLWHRNAGDVMHDTGPRTSTGKSTAWIRRILVVSEISLACVLLIGAGLLTRSFVKVLQVDLGFRPENTFVWSVNTARPMNSRSERFQFYNHLAECVSAVPGVESVGLNDSLPLGFKRAWALQASGVAYEPDGYSLAYVRMVDHRCLQTMRIGLHTGRYFDDRDTEDSQKVMIISETMARQLWPGRNPIGQTALVNGPEYTVVGVVSDVVHGLEEAPQPDMYLNIRQADYWSDMQLIVRARRDPDLLIPDIRAAIKEFDATLPSNEFTMLDGIVDRAIAPRRLTTGILGSFSYFALVLAAIGLYGVIACSVGQRTQEIGIRQALGAQRGDVVRLVIREGLRLVGFGIAVGLFIAFFVTRVLQSQLYGVAASDPFTYAITALVLLAVTLLACYIPARRAARIDPMEALRYE